MFKLDNKSLKCFITFVILGSILYLITRIFLIKGMFSSFGQSLSFSELLKNIPISEYIPASIVLSAFIFVYFVHNTVNSHRITKIALLTFILFYAFTLKDISSLSSHVATLSIALKSGMKNFDAEKMLSGEKLDAFRMAKQQLMLMGIDEDIISKMIVDYSPSSWSSLFNIKAQTLAISSGLSMAIIAAICCKICC